jgi:class 3 adenylate cyclase
MKKSAVWVVIQMVHGEEKAREACDRLTGEGFMVRFRSLSGETEEQVYEVLALSSEAREAREALLEWGL